jgi:hypothetical protein
MRNNRDLAKAMVTNADCRVATPTTGSKAYERRLARTLLTPTTCTLLHGARRDKAVMNSVVRFEIKQNGDS